MRAGASVQQLGAQEPGGPVLEAVGLLLKVTCTP